MFFFFFSFDFSQLTTRILEAHANVKDLTLTEAKLNYIKGMFIRRFQWYYSDHPSLRLLTWSTYWDERSLCRKGWIVINQIDELTEMDAVEMGWNTSYWDRAFFRAFQINGMELEMDSLPFFYCGPKGICYSCIVAGTDEIDWLPSQPAGSSVLLFDLSSRWYQSNDVFFFYFFFFFRLKKYLSKPVILSWLCSLAIVTRIWGVPFRGQVYGATQRRIAGRCLQPVDEDGYCNGRSHQNMALQHHEGEYIIIDYFFCCCWKMMWWKRTWKRMNNCLVGLLFSGVERQLGSETHDGAVRRGECGFQLPVGRL